MAGSSVVTIRRDEVEEIDPRIDDTEAGAFAATFLLVCLAAVEIEGVRLQDI